MSFEITCIAMLATSTVAALPQAPGIVVEEARRGGAAHGAGVEPGDVLHGWRLADPALSAPGPAKGRLSSPFALLEVEVEHGARGQLVLLASRDGDAIEFAMPPGAWGIQARPQLSPGELARYADARTRPPREAAAIFDDMAADAAARDDLEQAGWLLARGGDSLGRAGKTEDAAHALASAARQARRGTDAALLARLEMVAGVEHQRRGRAEMAQKRYRRAAELVGGLTPSSLLGAAYLDRLGAVAAARGALDRAEAVGRIGLAIRELRAPSSFDLMAHLNHMGNLLRRQGDNSRAAAYFHRCLAIQEELVPGSLLVAAGLNNLGLVLNDLGDLEGAQGYLQRSLELKERLAPGSLHVAATLVNLGSIRVQRGDLVAAENELRRCIELASRHPAGIDYALPALLTLALVAEERGDLDSARDALERALAMRQEITPDSAGVALILHSLAELDRRAGRLDSAEEGFRRALEIRHRLLPGGPLEAEGQAALAELALQRGNLEQAREDFELSLETRRKLAEGTLASASAMIDLARVELAAGQPDAAREHLDTALYIQEGVAPGSLVVARTLSWLAETARRSGEPETALNLLERALTIAQDLGIGGTLEARIRAFLAEILSAEGRTADAVTQLETAAAALEAPPIMPAEPLPYWPGPDPADGLRALAAAHSDAGRNDRALEASRQLQSFEERRLAAQQVLEPDPDLPAELDHRRRINTVKLRRALTAIATMATAPDASFDHLRAQLESLRVETAEIDAEIARVALSPQAGSAAREGGR